jgi:uncharacterized protein YjbI with pentapeptide repeats
VYGSNFVYNVSQVDWNGTPLPGATYYKSGGLVNTTGGLADEIHVTVPGSDLTKAGTFSVTVVNPTPGGGTSNPQVFYVTPPGINLVDFNQKTSTSTNGTATATVGGTGPGTTGSLTATGSGQGTVAIAQYSADPESISPPTAVAAYFDVYAAPGGSFSQVTITDCNLNGGSVIYWWTGSTWQQASNQTGPNNGCITVTLTASSSPTMLQLAGTPFGLGAPAAQANCKLGSYPHLSSGAVNLKNANLAGCNLAAASLAAANLNNATLDHAYLGQAQLGSANLSGASFRGVGLYGANLSAANLTQTNLIGATGLASATLTGDIWNNTTCPDGTSSNNDGGTCQGHL